MSETRMRAALILLARNLEGDGFDGRPLAYSLACDMAELARAAAFNEPHERLDNCIREAGLVV